MTLIVAIVQLLNNLISYLSNKKWEQRQEQIDTLGEALAADKAKLAALQTEAEKPATPLPPSDIERFWNS